MIREELEMERSGTLLLPPPPPPPFSSSSLSPVLDLASFPWVVLLHQ